MIKGSYIKKIFIAILLLSIFVQSTGCVVKRDENFPKSDSTSSIAVHMDNGWGFEPSTFVLHSDNKLTISYGARDMLGYEYDLYNLDETGGMGEDSDKYEKKVSRNDRKKIDEIIDSIKKNCKTYEELTFSEWTDIHVIYCYIDGEVYCAEYLPVKRADDLSKYDLNYQVVQLVYEFLKYAPVVEVDDGTFRYLRKGDGSKG